MQDYAPVSKKTASKFVSDFDCNWQRVNTFSHCVTLIHVLLPQIISYMYFDTKVPVIVVMGCKHASVIYVYGLIFLLHTSRSKYRYVFIIESYL